MPLIRYNGTYGWYSHIPKCAGSSVIHAVANSPGNVFISNEHDIKTAGKREDWSNVVSQEGWMPDDNWVISLQHWHMELTELFVLFDKIDFSFAMVRDPVDRMYSEFRFRHKAFTRLENAFSWQDWDLGCHSGHDQRTDDFLEWLENMKHSYIANPSVWDNHFRPQCEFVREDTHLFMYPEFTPLADFFEERFGFRPHFEKRNQSPAGDADKDITKECRNFIETWYTKDYEMIETKSRFG